MKTTYKTIEIRDKDKNLVETIILERKCYKDQGPIMEFDITFTEDAPLSDAMEDYEFYYFDDETEI